MFIDFYAIIAILLIIAVSMAVFQNKAFSIEGINIITEFSFYLPLAVSLVWMIITISYIADTSQLSVPLSFCFMLLLYASIIRITAMLFCIFKKSNKA